mmetsp:Transcript_4530/g.16087  ORF Transcript_4530/g.16087 Transcript_4530/m.16087 type:complete len:302 (-) Transcript_4530:27-932(-)
MRDQRRRLNRSKHRRRPQPRRDRRAIRIPLRALLPPRGAVQAVHVAQVRYVPRGELGEDLREDPPALGDGRVPSQSPRRVVLAFAVPAQINRVLRRVRRGEELHDPLREVRAHVIRQHLLAVVYELDVRQVVLAAVVLERDVELLELEHFLAPRRRRRLDGAVRAAEAFERLPAGQDRLRGVEYAPERDHDAEYLHAVAGHPHHEPHHEDRLELPPRERVRLLDAHRGRELVAALLRGPRDGALPRGRGRPRGFAPLSVAELFEGREPGRIRDGGGRALAAVREVDAEARVDHDRRPRREP